MILKDGKDWVWLFGGLVSRRGAHLAPPGHTPRTRFACARPFRFTKGADRFETCPYHLGRGDFFDD